MENRQLLEKIYGKNIVNMLQKKYFEIVENPDFVVEGAGDYCGDRLVFRVRLIEKRIEKAVIHLKLECEDDKLILAVRNPVTEKVKIENDMIKSKRGAEHGIGLLNVKAVVDKYGGDMVLSCDDNEFKAIVIL